MSADPLVSIVVNNHNYARFLPQAVDSALQQTWPSVEVIVVDDGSTDDSRAILDAYGDRITAVLQPNQGQAAALNAGFARSHGELVLFLDADDRLGPETIARVVEACRAQPGAAKVQYRMEVVDGTGAPTGRLKPPAYVQLLSGDLRRHYLTFPDDVWRMATSANVFPAWVLRLICPIPEAEYRAGADTYLTHVAPLFGPVVSLNFTGASYRVHGGNRYELAGTRLNLARIRRNVTHTTTTNRYLARFAGELGLPRSSGTRPPFLSVAYVANRIMSRKLEPTEHPVPGDRLPGLVVLGARAALGRFDVTWPMRLLYCGWFLLLALAPRPVAYRLGELMFFPEARGRWNALLSRFQRPARREPGP